MCRFNLSVERDRDNYRLVEANIEDICDLDLISQGEQVGPQILSQVLPLTPCL